MCVPSRYETFRGLFSRWPRLEKVLGMANESVRGFRGWIYAIFVAICLLLLFFASETLSRVKQPGFDHAPRTTTLRVSTKPKTFPRIATEALPLEIEALSAPLESADWVGYRSLATHSLAMLEPPAGARLSAPIASDILSDPFLDTMLQRSPSVLAANAASAAQTPATNVSSTRPIDSEVTEEVTEELASNVLVHASSAKNAWPVSASFQSELARANEAALTRSHTEMLAWIERISAVYTRLTETALSDEKSYELLEAMHTLSSEGVSLTEKITSADANLARDIARLSYCMERRYAVWMAVSKCVGKGKQHFVSMRNHEVDAAKLSECLANVRALIQRTGDAPSWERYLMIPSLQKLTNGGITGRQDQVDLVREFLSRVTDSRVSEPQRTLLTSTEVHRLADQVHPLSIGPVDYQKVIEDIETLESDPVHRCSTTLADAMQSLRFSEYPEQAAVAQAIGIHYRNANLRIAVSEEFINRMMPGQTVMEKPVRQTIMGADTRGASQIATKLKVDFQPDPNAWKIALNLDGDISSKTKSSRNGATFYNSSIANVNAVRDIAISTKSIEINGRPASVESTESLRNFSTDWDALPVLGDMIRKFAHQEFLQARPIAKRIMQKTIATQTDAEFDKQLQERMQSAQGQFKTRLLGPLQSLDLNPMVVDMQSTDTRLIVRYRLAGSDQLSAYTARPIAPSDSQLSMQVHQSAFNNMVGQVIDGNRNWTMQELSDKISDLLQQPRRVLAEDAPTDVTARFADARPITVEFEDGRMWLTLRVASLEQPGRLLLKNFIIRTSYFPTVDGLQADLTREGVISVDGHKLGMRDRVPLRAIFSRVFSNRSSLPMVSDELIKDPRASGLAVSQLDLRDGWLAVAISNTKSPHVALVKNRQESARR